jgi:arylsulfatase A-like enzyme
VFTNDHGEELFERGQVGHTNSLWDELVRAPLMLRVPGVEPGIDHRVASNLDVVPTVLEALGIAVPDNLEGISLLGPAPEGRIVQSETFKNAKLRSAVDGKYKLIRNLNTGGEQLFLLENEGMDLLSDPAHADAAARLRAALDAKFTPQSAAGPRISRDAEEIERLKALGYIGD